MAADRGWLMDQQDYQYSQGCQLNILGWRLGAQALVIEFRLQVKRSQSLVAPNLYVGRGAKAGRQLYISLSSSYC